MKQKFSIIEGAIKAVNEGDEFSWIELINPSKEEVQEVMDEYNLPKDYLFDIDDPNELPRTEGLEDERPNLFILNYPVKISEGSFTTRPVAVISVDNIIITVRNSETNLFEEMKKNIKRIKSNDDIENLVIEIAWSISKAFIDFVKEINKNILYLENSLKKSTKTESIYALIDLQKSLINFQTATNENAPIIESIFDLPKLDEAEYRDDLLRDLQIENKQARVMIEKSSFLIDHLSDLYSNVISNNMNVIMKKLTAITIIMTIPTIIGGLWGMNVKLPIEKVPSAFWLLILLTVIASIITFIYLRRKDYF